MKCWESSRSNESDEEVAGMRGGQCCRVVEMGKSKTHPLRNKASTAKEGMRPKRDGYRGEYTSFDLIPPRAES